MVNDAFVPEHRVLDPEACGDTDIIAWEMHGRTTLPSAPARHARLGADRPGHRPRRSAAIEDFVLRRRGTKGRARSAERRADAAASGRGGRRSAHGARLYRATVGEFLAKAKRGERFSDLEKARYLRDNAYVVKLCVQAVNRLFDVSGGRALYSSTTMQRIHRDTHALSHRDGMTLDFAAVDWGRLSLQGGG